MTQVAPDLMRVISRVTSLVSMNRKKKIVRKDENKSKAGEFFIKTKSKIRMRKLCTKSHSLSQKIMDNVTAVLPI